MLSRPTEGWGVSISSPFPLSFPFNFSQHNLRGEARLGFPLLVWTKLGPSLTHDSHGPCEESWSNAYWMWILNFWVLTSRQWHLLAHQALSQHYFDCIWESKPENDGAVLFSRLRHLQLRISMKLLERLWKEALDLPIHQKREEPGINIGINAHSSWRGSPLLWEIRGSVWRCKEASVHYQTPAGLYDNFYNFFIHNSGCFEG